MKIYVKGSLWQNDHRCKIKQKAACGQNGLKIYKIKQKSSL